MEKLQKFYKLEEDYQNLKSLLVKNLPKEINGFSSKENFPFRFLEKTSKQLESKKWIEYNQSWVNFIIIDIDNNNMDNIMGKCLEMGIEPTIICNTDKGCHCFFHLENIIMYEWKKPIKFLRDIKIFLTKKLNGDIAGSHRIKGIWRNPLLHNFYYSDISYSLNDFKPLIIEEYKKLNKQSPKKKFKDYIKNKSTNLGKSLFVKGNRDYFLFIEGMKFSQNKNLEVFEIENYLLNLQNQFEVENLTNSEIKRISRSVGKYNIQNKNFVKSSKSEKTYNIGVMDFIPINEMERMTQTEIKEEIKRRQKTSIERTIILREENEDYKMTRLENVKKMTKNKEDKNRKIIINCLTGLFNTEYKKLNGKWNYKKISTDLKLNFRTVKKYIEEFEEKKTYNNN